jgi:hypothetical protein
MNSFLNNLLTIGIWNFCFHQNLKWMMSLQCTNVTCYCAQGTYDHDFSFKQRPKAPLDRPKIHVLYPIIHSWANLLSRHFTGLTIASIEYSLRLKIITLHFFSPFPRYQRKAVNSTERFPKILICDKPPKTETHHSKSSRHIENKRPLRPLPYLDIIKLLYYAKSFEII